MIIPAEQLSPDTLRCLIEEFITREGTDYGAEEVALSRKVQQVNQQIVKAEVVIVFDAATESVNLMSTVQYREWMANTGSD
ncbi:MAG: hypothetical protein ACI9NY_000933 [Kiritimatiellia bacterium]|jgi:uncharacterized protein YheU (UPF0270 family)